MLRKLRRLIVVSMVAAVIATVAPVPSHAAPSPCQGRTVSAAQDTQTIAVAGVYRSDGFEVRLTCGVVQNGVTVARFTDDLFGPVAALADSVTVPAGAYTVCYDVYITYIEGATSTTTCP